MTDVLSGGPPAPPVTSPDGRWWWDGTTWQPMPVAVDPQTATSASPAPAASANEAVFGSAILPESAVNSRRGNRRRRSAPRPRTILLAATAAVMVTAVLGAVVLVGGGHGTRHVSVVKSASLSEHRDITGQVTLVRHWKATVPDGFHPGDGCEGLTNQYDATGDLVAGAPVVVTDERGTVVASTDLSEGKQVPTGLPPADTSAADAAEADLGIPSRTANDPTNTDDGQSANCVFAFSLTGMPTRDFYSVKVGDRPARTVAMNELKSNGWKIALMVTSN